MPNENMPSVAVSLNYVPEAVPLEYYGTKRVKAWPHNKVELGSSDSPGEMIPGYGIEYPDGYQSWCPAEVFEAAYQPLDALNFGHALDAAKRGYKIARAGWNGKGMFIYYVPANTYAAQTEAARSVFGDMVPYRAYLAMKTVDNDVVPWVASQTDILANDWMIVS